MNINTYLVNTVSRTLNIYDGTGRTRRPYLFDWVDVSIMVNSQYIVENANGMLSGNHAFWKKFVDISGGTNWDISRYVVLFIILGDVHWARDWDTSNIRDIEGSLQFAYGSVTYLSNWNTNNFQFYSMDVLDSEIRKKIS